MIHYVDCRLRLHSSDSTGGKIHIVSEQQRRIRLRLQPSGKWLRCPFKAKHTIVSLTIHNLTQEVIHRTQIQWPARLRLRDNRTAAPRSSGKMFLWALWSTQTHTNTQKNIQCRCGGLASEHTDADTVQSHIKPAALQIKTRACTIFHSWVVGPGALTGSLCQDDLRLQR